MTAAWGGLKPAPDRRLRRAFRHLPYSLLRRTVIQPDGVADDLGGESGIRGSSARRISSTKSATLPLNLTVP